MQSLAPAQAPMHDDSLVMPSSEASLARSLTVDGIVRPPRERKPFFFSNQARSVSADSVSIALPYATGSGWYKYAKPSCPDIAT